MKSQRVPSADKFSTEDKKVLELYLNEYNDTFPQILSLPSCEFLQNIVKRVELTSSKKFNGISQTSKSKAEAYLCDHIYSKDYKIANMILKSFRKRQDNNQQLKHFEGNIIDHCLTEKDHVHSCGEKFAVFKYTFTSGEKSKKQLFLICLKCEMIYKSSLVLFHCRKCDQDFYSKVLENEDNKEELPYATWKKYHCNAIINDTMKCPECKQSLRFDQPNYKLVCLNCNRKCDPQDIMWKCILCQKDFYSEPKAYNSLEFKNMKICVKDSLVNKVKAKPDKITCGCEYDISKMKFYHKNTCKGELYLGEMNKKKIIVCSKCDALSFYDNFVWTCPLCEKKFKTTGKVTSSGMKNHLIKYDSANKISKNVEYKNESDGKKNKRVMPMSSKKITRNLIPTPNKFNKSGLKRMESSRSPYLLLKENLAKRFSGIEIEDSIRNLGKVFLKEEEKEKLLNRMKEEKEEKKEKAPITSCNINSVSTASLTSGQDQSESNSTLGHEKSERGQSNSGTLEAKKDLDDFEVNDYKILKQIGEGSFGKIYLVESPSGKKYALKKIVGTTFQELQSLKHEYEILLSLQKCGENISLVSIHGIQTKKLDLTTYVMYVLMDLASTDWEKEIISRNKRKKYYTEQELLGIVGKLIHTFAQLQKNGISHRDIKPQNILVFEEDRSFKLADFGEAKELLGNRGNTDKQTLRGTELYMSPILFQALRSRQCNIKYIQHNTFKSDVFSFGLCCFFAATLVFESLYDVREINNMLQMKLVIERYLKKRYSYKTIDLIFSMLDVNEKTRYDFIELEKYYNSYISV